MTTGPTKEDIRKFVYEEIEAARKNLEREIPGLIIHNTGYNIKVGEPEDDLKEPLECQKNQ